MTKQLSRREFIQWSSATALAGAVPLAAPLGAAPPARGPFRGTLCLFSKPVPQLNWRELAQAAKQAGFGGIDLTVRPGGHVLPEKVKTDLPKAVETIRAEGLEVPMITTDLHSADDPAAEPTFSTASKLSIPYLKPGYYRYKFVNVLKELAEAGKQFRTLIELASRHHVQVGYHNHEGYIGAPVWDMARVIEPLDPRWCGYYFDLLQATAEGGVGGWKIAANLVMPRVKMLAAKDFYWKQIGPHRWEPQDCPIGQGMSHWREFLMMVAQSNFHGPITVHEEYGIPGAARESGIAISRATVDRVMEEAKRNLDTLKSLLREAYEQA